MGNGGDSGLLRGTRKNGVTRCVASTAAQGHDRLMNARTLARLLAAGAALAGCYGGISVGIGPDDDPPNVSLAAAPSSAAPGERIGLVAAASDDYRVREVQFFRVDPGGERLLGRDGNEPFALETTLPSAAGSLVRYFARAVDDAGQEADSQEVVVTVR
jgi:hypothetical protein